MIKLKVLLKQQMKRKKIKKMKDLMMKNISEII